MSEQPRARKGEQRPLTIEECLQKLKEISTAMQAEDIRMDDAMRLYRQGAKLANEADKLLRQYESEIEVIELEASGDTE